MTLGWEQVIIDSANPSALGNWWAKALGWTVVSDEPDEVEIQPELGVTPGLMFAPVPEAKAGKNACTSISGPPEPTPIRLRRWTG